MPHCAFKFGAVEEDRTLNLRKFALVQNNNLKDNKIQFNYGRDVSYLDVEMGLSFLYFPLDVRLYVRAVCKQPLLFLFYQMSLTVNVVSQDPSNTCRKQLMYNYFISSLVIRLYR